MDYFDADVAYLIGLIVARGQLIEQGEERRILVEFPSSKRLLTTFGRQDVLVYHQPRQQVARSVVLARWDIQNGLPDVGSVIPSGGL